MTRVLHLITGLGLGGAEHQLVLLARHLPVRCEVATLTGPATLAGELRELGVPVHDLGMAHNRDLKVLPRLVSLMRRGRYDAIHTHLYRACLYGRVAARAAGVRRIIATEHSLGDGHLEGRSITWPVRAMYRASERLGSATVAVSPTVERRLRDWGIPARRLVTIPNGLDPAAFAFDPVARGRVREALGIGPADFVVGTVGRLVRTKRVDVLIEAVERVPGARLLIVGDGPDAPRLHGLASASGDRVVFAGARQDVAAHLSAMDAFASPSAQETFGLSVLEALANGLPTLYTTCPAVEDLAGRPGGGPGEPPVRRLPGTAEAYAAALRELAERSATAPSTMAPSTTAPSTMAPSTTAPSTMAPSTTAPSAMAPSTMERPVPARPCAAAARAYAIDELVARLVALYQADHPGPMTTSEEAHP
ncbi:glycosyltransferase [Actinomadura logoneensis]|uniref:Glycosyltransferase n=1 Tax=Actinomadura logoneensis TaxID=2293572 RepID=A0A372JJK7_9ACTN|nr:glycosyltransferase [Actinomadura logoneensis]RFU40201.1 glycosyltransferase [Actinomadura logoneensis]